MEAPISTSTNIPRIDAHLSKFSQACVIVLTGVAFIRPFRLLYRYVMLPLHLLKPRIVEDDPAPHRFAQGVGATFLIASTLVLFLAHATVVGWALDIIVFVLAGINFTVGFCAGCFVYYHLGRLGLLPHVRYQGGFHWRGV